ncbi:MAG: LLM class flavin-dependent oxidoreductase [Solirubrobacterales bacterium]|nr:LLM class flavin-dependent oxidoreductase [Solirubrobacterales bacterium]
MAAVISASVLDQAPIRAGISAADAIREVTDLARHAEQLGYRRFWIAEHHALGALASTAPEVLIGHVANQTQRIRVGSGGMLLPNHRPLHVAETFGVLGALYPGRIDLGVGRAEGTLDKAIVKALQRPAQTSHDDGYPEQVDQLLAFAGIRTLPHAHPLQSVRATPQIDPFPPVFLLGSSTGSAATAAARNLGYGFAAYTNPEQMAPAIRHYKQTAQTPRAILGLKLIVGENDEHAEALAGSFRLASAQARTGNPQPLQEIETVQQHKWTTQELEQDALQSTAADAVGGPETVSAKLDQLIEQTGADELIITTNVFDPAERFASFKRLAELLGLP